MVRVANRNHDLFIYYIILSLGCLLVESRLRLDRIFSRLGGWVSFGWMPLRCLCSTLVSCIWLGKNNRNEAARVQIAKLAQGAQSANSHLLPNFLKKRPGRGCQNQWDPILVGRCIHHPF